MKNTLFLLLILVCLNTVDCLAQAYNEPIESIEKGLLFKKKVYKKCDIELTPTQLITLFKNDPNMNEYYKPVALNYTAALLLNTAATILILWPITESLYDEGDPNWNLAYIGAGCALLAIPFNLAFNKKSEAAVNYYNSGYQSSSLRLNLQMSGNGLGLVMHF